MSANAIARPIQVLIGADNQDWSAAYVGFRMGDPERGTDGLFLQQGKLRLGLINNAPESMNPRSSTGKIRFARGQRVIINIWDGSTFVRHPRGWAYIAKPPLPATPVSPYLDLDLVCVLDLQRFPQPPAEIAIPERPLTPNTPIPQLSRADLILSCFDKAGITNPTNLSIPKYPVVQPAAQEEGDGFATYAGEVAYGGIAGLWQDNQGTIQSISLAIAPATPILTLEIGRDEISYEPTQGGESPSEKVIYEGEVTGLKIPDEGSPDDNNPDNYTTTEEYAPAQIISPDYRGTIISRRIRQRGGTAGGSKWSQTITEVPKGILSPTVYPKQTSLIIESDIRVDHRYSNGRLNQISTVERKPFLSAAAEYISTLSTAQQQSYAGVNVNIVTDERRSYDSEDRTQQIVVTTSEPIAAIVSDERLSFPLDDRISKIQRTAWNQKRKGIWEKIETVSESLIRVAPNVDLSRLSGNLADFKAALISKSVVVSSSAQDSPPATERSPNSLETEEKPITGEAQFDIYNNGFSPRERRYKLDKLCTGTEQLQELAQIQGALLIGRAQGASIEFAFNNVFLSNPNPLQAIAVIETETLASGTRKNLIYYQLDALEFSHEFNEAKVFANLIWLGTIEGSIVAHTNTPTAPTFSAATLDPPYQSLTLSAIAGSVNGSFDNEPPLAVIRPPFISSAAMMGTGVGIEAQMIPRSLMVSVLSTLSVGVGLRTNLTPPVLAGIGVGVGMSGSDRALPITALIGVGAGLRTDFNPPVLAVTAVGLGMRADIVNPPVLAIAGVGIGGDGTDAIRPHGFMGVGTGLNSIWIERQPALMGIGIGAFGALFPEQVEPETTALLARLGGTYSESRRSAINAFIKGLKDDGLWTTLAILKIYAAPTEADSLLNWVSTSFNATKVGTPTFTSDRGFTGTGNNTGYIRSNFVPSTDGGAIVTQDSATYGVYNLTNANDTDYMGALTTSPSSRAVRISLQSGTIVSALNNSSDSSSNTIPNPTGTISVTRTDASVVRTYRDGALITAATTTSVGLPAHELFTLSYNSDGTATGGLPHQIAAEWVAGGWTQAQNTAFHRRLDTYLASFGAIALPDWGYFYTTSQSSVYLSSAVLTATWSNLTDGVGTTGGATDSSGTQWIQADLGSAQSVSSVRVGGGNLPGWGGVVAYLNSRLIQHSNDATNWTTVATISGVTDSGVDQFRSFTFTTVSARYWRIVTASTGLYLSTTEFVILP